MLFTVKRGSESTVRMTTPLRRYTAAFDANYHEFDQSRLR